MTSIGLKLVHREPNASALLAEGTSWTEKLHTEAPPPSRQNPFVPSLLGKQRDTILHPGALIGKVTALVWVARKAEDLHGYLTVLRGFSRTPRSNTRILPRKSGTLRLIMRRTIALSLLACSCLGYSQNLGNPGQYFQFRKMSSLSGGGFGVTINGDPSIAGAMAFSTPIGYSLGGGVWQIGAGSRSSDNAPKFINLNSHGHNDSSGDAEVMAGIGTDFGHFTFGYEAVSYERYTVFHLQYQLPLHSKDLGVSIGAQDLTNRKAGGAISSRSLFAVGTYEYMKGDHVSVGYGDGRFHGPFANTDYLINSKFKGTLEYDTFEFNPGLAYSIGRIKGLGDLDQSLTNNEVTLFAGYLNFHYCTVGLSWVF